MTGQARTGWIIPLGFTLLAIAPGCGTAEYRRAKGFDPRVPLRVAVLPFIDTASGDNIVSVAFATTLDLVPVLSDE